MFTDDQDDQATYVVVINHEEQYSIWPADCELPHGWQSVGHQGPKPECLEYIKEVWHDMRPLSLRVQMEKIEHNEARRPIPLQNDEQLSNSDSIVDTLCQGLHPIEVSLRPQKSLALLNECIDRGYLQMKFVQTQGGTEVGVRLNKDACGVIESGFAIGAGQFHVEGELTLDSIPVRCIADIDLTTFAGMGRIVRAVPAEAH
jgi:uncharacterized protein YbdZ (MbtH family)